jgi:hypothetical protein
MPKIQQPTNVFISHARVDAPKLELIIRSLIERGLIQAEDRILKEEDLPTKHRSLREEVKRQIQSASKVVVVWGTASAMSQWVNYEIGLADALGKPIIAVVPQGSVVALPGNLQDVQIVKVGRDG